MNANLNFGDNFLNNAERNYITNLNKGKDITFPAEIVKDYQAWYVDQYGAQAIKKLQTALNLESSDGIIGRKTLFSIIRYQKDNGLTPDGLLDNEEMNTLIHNYQNSLKNTQQKTVNNQGALSQEVNDLRDIQAYYGDFDKNLIKEIQKYLHVRADGIVGSKTIMAIKNFQQSIGAEGNGKLSQNDLEKIRSNTNREQLNASIQMNALKGLPSFNKAEIQQWYKAEKIDSKTIQSMQRALGVFPATGVINDNTIAYVALYQQKIGLEPTGKMSLLEIGHLTKRSLTSNKNTEIRELRNWWQQNHSTEAIMTLQTSLGVPVDGIVGLATIDAIKKAQKEKGMPITGKLNRNEIALINTRDKAR